jgi:hypothetical protein
MTAVLSDAERSKRFVKWAVIASALVEAVVIALFIWSTLRH